MTTSTKLTSLKILVVVWFLIIVVVMLMLDSAATRSAAAAQSGQLPPGLTSLTTIPAPEPDNIADFVRDRNAAIALGKALFWDMQAGSDGIQSCASCHFHAGADSRAVNQLNPGTRGGDQTFKVGPPNYTLTAADFPFHRLADPDDRYSSVLFDANDVASSQGVFRSIFNSVTPGSATESVTFVADLPFSVNGVIVRRVEARNTPTVINAVFNFRNFWDGRAQEDFNGVNPFGQRDPDARVWDASDPNNPLHAIVLHKSSLASQAVGPPSGVNPNGFVADDAANFEMSANKRIFPDIGRKMLSMTPLAKQRVATDDSVLGTYANPNGNGLNATTYKQLVEQAFQPKWWQNTTQTIHFNRNPQSPTASRTFAPPANNPPGPDDFTQEEYNFSLFWGIAIQMYEATLRSDDTPFDRYANGDSSALTEQQKQGLDIFAGEQAKCINCHGGAEFTNASFRNVQNNKIERMLMGDNLPAVYDNGFYNIGVRLTDEDIGVGGDDPFGKPLSFARFFQLFNPGIQVQGEPDSLSGPLSATERVAVKGAFKTCQLRNVELTAPYFHNGGQLTLRQVVDFYNRGGDFHDQNLADLDPDIQNLGLNNAQKDALVAFLVGLTDERVRFHRAPFDHPSLKITNGHPNPVVSDGQPGAVPKAQDMFIEIPAVGSSGLETPLPNFPLGHANSPPGTANMILTATAVSNSQAAVSWTPPGGTVHHYQIERSKSINEPYTLLLPYRTATNLTDSGLDTNTAYLYRVRAVDAAGNTIGSSNRDLATIIIFSDDPLVAGVTFIKAQHILELRLAVNAVRACAGLTPFTWTDAELSGAVVKAAHVQEPRTNLDQALNSLGLPVSNYTDNSLAGLPVKKVHVEELRARVK